MTALLEGVRLGDRLGEVDGLTEGLTVGIVLGWMVGQLMKKVFSKESPFKSIWGVEGSKKCVEPGGRRKAWV